jgi:hypothetical protein
MPRGSVFRPAIAAAGLVGRRPYDLRHSFVSLLIAEGHNVVEVARQAGHSPKMALDTYASSRSSTQPSASTPPSASAGRARTCGSYPASRRSSTSRDFTAIAC